MATLLVTCPACWGHGSKGQTDPRKPNLPCAKCEAGRVSVEAGCDACSQTGLRVAGNGWSFDTCRFEPIQERCACVTRALEARGFYRGRRKRSA